MKKNKEWYSILHFAETQFMRVLWENLGIQLNEIQSKSLCDKYNLKGDGRINYKAFCEIIDQPFNPNDLVNDPKIQTTAAKEL